MKHKKLWSALLGTGLVVLPIACGGKPAVEITTLEVQPTDPPALKEAKEIFAGRCVTCHGNTGHGDGPGSSELNPKPRSYADKEWQKTVTDEHLAKIIVRGGQAVGLSSAMVANPDLKSKPEVVDYLVQIIRFFGKN